MHVVGFAKVKPTGHKHFLVVESKVKVGRHSQFLPPDATLPVPLLKPLHPLQLLLVMNDWGSGQLQVLVDVLNTNVGLHSQVLRLVELGNPVPFLMLAQLKHRPLASTIN
jgi:hypothetical protein